MEAETCAAATEEVGASSGLVIEAAAGQAVAEATLEVMLAVLRGSPDAGQSLPLDTFVLR